MCTAALKPRPLPRHPSTVFDQGFDDAAELLALGIQPTLLDLTEEPGGINLHLVFEGYREGVTAQEARSLQVCAQFGGRDVGPELTLAYWQDRHQSAVEYKQSALGKPRRVRWNRSGSRDFDYLHLGLPISKVLDYRKGCDRIMAGSGVKIVEYAIWSRPELFSMLLLLVAEQGAECNFRDNLNRAVEQVLTLAQDMGGVMEYCHGVGVKLNHLLAREMGAGHDVVRAMKQALDPTNIMNPGKLGLYAPPPRRIDTPHYFFFGVWENLQSLSHRSVGELTNTGVGAMGLKRGRPVQFHWPLVGPQKGRLPLLVPWGLGPAPRGLATAP